MCKHSESDHKELTQRQKRLDARGNDVTVTNRESEWAVGLARSLKPEDSKLLFDHLKGLAKGYPSNDTDVFKGRLKALKDDYQDDPFQLAAMLADHDAKFKPLVDLVGARLPKPINDWYWDTIVPQSPFLEGDARGRANPIRPTTERIARNPHAGITTSAGRSGELKDVFGKNVSHGHGMFLSDESSETYKAFKEQGAPFIAGASGTLRYLMMQMESEEKRSEIDANTLAAREKLIGIHSAMMVIAGHHSVAECLLAAQAFGYFTDVPDPMKDYDGAMAAFERRLGGAGLTTDKPLSREADEGGKTKEELNYRDARADLMAQYDRYRDQMAPGSRALFERHLKKADAAADGARWKGALDFLEDARASLSYDIMLVRARSSGSPRVLKSADLVEKFGGRKPHKGKKKSVAYKATAQALDEYQASYAELAKTPLTGDYSENSYRELRGKLAAVVASAQEYIDKHRKDKSKADERAAMQAVIDDARREQALLEQALRDPGVSDYEDVLTLAQAVEFKRRGVNLKLHGDPRALDERRLKRDQCRHFGSGGVNDVQQLVYAKDPDGEEIRIFKHDPETERIPPGVQEIGLDPSNPGFGKRNVATRKACENLGLGDLIPPTTFALVDGKLGIAMGKAEGESLQKDVDTVVTPPIPPEDQWKRNGIRRNEQNVIVYKRNTPNPLDLESDPDVDEAFQEQIMALQWLDGFCGQVDRHDKNYLIDVQDGTVKVCGIDNDFSFGKHHTGVESLEPNEHSQDGALGNLGRQFCGLPPLIDRKLYDRIDQMTFDQFTSGMAGLLSAEEKSAAQRRFDELQGHARRLHPDHVVDSWKDFRTPDGKSAKQMMLDSPKPNYYKRDITANRQRGGH